MNLEAAGNWIAVSPQATDLVYGAATWAYGAGSPILLEVGGEEIGVITRQLVKMEVALTSLENLEVVETMHERKARMAELADGFIAMPGGLGTIEEIFEVITWSQLGIHKKPCAFLNTDGYYDGLFSFSGPRGRRAFHWGCAAEDDPAGPASRKALLDKMAAYHARRNMPVKALLGKETDGRCVFKVLQTGNNNGAGNDHRTENFI
jgi:uncharacterized protein (TIGR00730 family)